MERVCRHEEHTNEGQQEAERLQGIGAHDGEETAVACVEPDECQHGGRQQDENGQRVAVRGDDELLQNEAHQKETGCRSSEFAENEEESASAVSVRSEAAFQIRINAGEFQAVIELEQHEGYNEVAKEKACTHLQVGHARARHPSRDGDKRYARDAGANHAEADHPPRRAARGTEESIVVVVLAAGVSADEQEQKKIGH